MAYPRKRIYRKRPTKKVYRKKSTRNYKSRSFKLAVKRVVQSVAERKVAYFESSPVDLNNQTNTTIHNNTIVLTPYSGSALSISQGVTQNTRIGDSIKVKKAMLKFFVYPQNYDVTSNPVPIPQVCLCYLWRLKTVGRDIGTAVAVEQGSFFQQGASSTGMTGVLTDYLKDINKDKVTLLKRFKFKIGAALYAANTGAQDEFYDFSNNDFTSLIMKKLDVSKYINTIKWNDTDSVPSISPLYFTISPCNCDGSATGTAAIPLTWSWRINYEYTDV